MKSGDGKNYKCQRCGRLFYALNSLHFHELNHMLAETRQPSLKKTNRVKNEKQESEFADAKCMALYQQLISENGSSSGKVSCPECGKKISRTGILSHLRQHTGSLPFKCSFCMKQFADIAVMRRHLKVHLGIMYYRCVALVLDNNNQIILIFVRTLSFLQSCYNIFTFSDKSFSIY